MKIKMKTYKPKNLKNLTWPQAKARFPNMKPLGDADGDKLKNKFDCKPFDIKRKGEEHDDGKKEGRVTATEDIRRCPKCGSIMATSKFTDNWEGFKCFRCNITI